VRCGSAGAGNAVYVVFFGNGFLFANWAARIPQVRAGLGVTPPAGTGIV
jgi:hypothetical protein